MSGIEIRKIGITRLDTDAIVNAANEGLRAGGGVCGAIFKEAGYRRLQEACDKIGQDVLDRTVKTKYPAAKKSDWKTMDMPEQHAKFVLKRPFTEHQMRILRGGHVPEAMEDKWFWYMEGSTLYAHRSWTGFCIYRIDFQPDNKHIVTVNRDPGQFKSTSLQVDAEQLDELLDWWIQDRSNYYDEWLSETAKALDKAGKLRDKPESADS